ncbi:MAG: FAD-dependent oxidoreductase [Rubrivivax sp.]|nr:FAD-dependent oxidoreductase [Rubrivivax sp.]
MNDSVAVPAAAVQPPAPPQPVAPVPATWTTGSTEVFKTGTWRAALPRHIHAPSPCRNACPVNGDIAEWIGHARAGDFKRAFDVLARHNPFPAIAGRVCHHPCESACNRPALDGQAVSICRLERYVGDRALAEGWPLPTPEQARAADLVAARGKRVAVVGGGPAGLSAAYQLRRRGYSVTVFEASSEAGGLLRHGIPSYRLARDVLDAEIARIVALGVEVRCNEPLQTEAQWRAMREKHDAVFVATGAALPKRLPGLAYEGARVLDGAAWLRAANAGQAPSLGKRVVVLGGGSAALDAARSARRAGHDVTVLALEPRSQMPAQREEVDEALEEGIGVVDGAMLLAAEDRGSRSPLTLHCIGVRFHAGTARGSFTVERIEGSEFDLVADALLTSIGQDPDLAPFGDTLARDGALIATAAASGGAGGSGATALPGVWAGGDVASAARFFTEAVGMGKRAAADIDRALLAAVGTQTSASPSHSNGAAAFTAGCEVVPASAIATWYHVRTPRAPAALRPLAERLAGNGGAAGLAEAPEVQLGFAEIEAALAEAERCFSCGTCITCDNCVVVCPDLALRRVEGTTGYEVLGDYCKGCGLCVRECPTGSMTMVEERR